MAKSTQDAHVQSDKAGEAVVVCDQCGKQIGRVQTKPTTADADQEQVNAEIRLIVDEHQTVCGEAD